LAAFYAALKLSTVQFHDILYKTFRGILYTPAASAALPQLCWRLFEISEFDLVTGKPGSLAALGMANILWAYAALMRCSSTVDKHFLGAEAFL
jgi:hypothetical protein